MKLKLPFLEWVPSTTWRSPSAINLETMTWGCGSITSYCGNIKAVHRKSLFKDLQVPRITVIWNWQTLPWEPTSGRRNKAHRLN